MLLTAAYQAEVEYRRRKYEENEMTLSYIGRMAAFLTSPSESPKFGFMFCGRCGNGKTTLLRAMQTAVNYLSNNNYFREPKGVTCLDAKDLAAVSRNLEALKAYRDKELLAIEDMGREPSEVLEYGNRLNPVADMIEYRYDRQLFTGITTNLTPKEIREVYGDRVADRFNEMLEVIIFENKSYRV